MRCFVVLALLLAGCPTEPTGPLMSMSWTPELNADGRGVLEFTDPPGQILGTNDGDVDIAFDTITCEDEGGFVYTCPAATTVVPDGTIGVGFNVTQVPGTYTATVTFEYEGETAIFDVTATVQ